MFKNASLITHHGKHIVDIFSECFTLVNIRAFSKQGEVVGLICFNERILEYKVGKQKQKQVKISKNVLLILTCFCFYFPTLYLSWRMKILNTRI